MIPCTSFCKKMIIVFTINYLSNNSNTYYIFMQNLLTLCKTI